MAYVFFTIKTTIIMRYAQLRAFHQVAIERSFSRAAKILCVTQPAISDQVTKLEKHYDAHLFDRTSRQIMLTKQGEKLLSLTRQFFDIEALAYDFLSESRLLGEGKLHIMTDSVLHINEILLRFNSLYPAIRISLHIANTETILSKLTSYETDIGVLSSNPASDRFNVFSLGSSPMVAIASKKLGIKQQESVTLKQLSTMPLIMREQGSKTREQLEKAALSEGISLKTSIEAQGREVMRDLVFAGVGVGFISLSEYQPTESLFSMRIEGKNLNIKEFIISLKQREEVKTIKYFMAIAHKIIAEIRMPITDQQADKRYTTRKPV